MTGARLSLRKFKRKLFDGHGLKSIPVTKPKKVDGLRVTKTSFVNSEGALSEAATQRASRKALRVIPQGPASFQAFGVPASVVAATGQF